MIKDESLEKKIIDFYVKENLSIQQIKEKTGKGYKYIRRILKENNVEVKIGLRQIKLKENEIRLLEKLAKQGKSIKEIAQEVGYDIKVIKRTAKENNILLKYTINPNFKENFFENIDTEEKAYLLGLYFTDGCVRKNSRCELNYTIHMQLQARDLEMIEKIKDIFQVNNKIYHDKRNNKECYEISFSSRKMAQDLSKYGIVPRKTYETSHLPLEYIPDNLKIHFLRGLFDGDGGFSVDSSYSKDVSFDFTSYHSSICEEFQKEIDELINKNNHNKIYTNIKDGAQRSRVSWRGKQQVLRILDILYENATIYLKRKHDKYLELKAH